MVLVVSEAERAECTVHTVQAIHVTFALVGIGMMLALNKEGLFQKWLQPWWPPVVLIIRTSSTHDSSVLGLDFPDSVVVLVFDRQLENFDWRQRLY